MLTKVRVGEYFPDAILSRDLFEVINFDFIPNSIYYTNGNIVINDKSDYSYRFLGNRILKLNKLDRINTNFMGIYIWKHIYSFDQNSSMTKDKIRNFIALNLIKSKSDCICGFGGEYYGYFCLLREKYNKFYGLTNNEYIYNDAEFNMKMYLNGKKYFNSLTNYNDNINTFMKGDVIVNLSTITKYVINFLLINNFNRIVIVSCKEKNYKKILKLNEKYNFVNRFIINDEYNNTRIEIFVFDKFIHN
jgi:hypothetical protein